MSYTLLQIDAFASKPFTGNPAAVCLLDKPQEAAWMQAMAAEMNLAETAFLVPRDGKGEGYDLRWFTPAIEVDLCGHATLASAHGLWELGQLPGGETAQFHTRSGLLTCRKDGAWIWMDFPAHKVAPLPIPAGLPEALRLPSNVRIVYFGRYPASYFVVLESEEAVRNLKPDFGALSKISRPDAKLHAVLVTARATTPGLDFVSRFFAPWAGIDEDPVTGSAHCALTPYWSAQLGKTSMTAYQASPRGGTVRLEAKGDRVLLGGQAVTVLKGELV